MPDIPYGYCRCGCGQKTNLAPNNATKGNLTKGEPLKFIRHHGRKGPTKRPINNGLYYCTGCKIEKPVELFSKDKSRPNGYSNKCSECDRTYQAKRRKEKPDHCKAIRKQGRMKAYSISPEQYAALFAKQEGKCAICRLPETRTRKGTLCDLPVDHDHKTGQVRGLLCAICNAGLGQFKDDPALLELAIQYLKRYGRTSSSSEGKSSV